MSFEFRVFLPDDQDLENLREWMSGHSGVTLRLVERPGQANGQGSVLELLSVVCATGGPVVAALRALQLWLEARVTSIEIEIENRRIMIRSSDAKTLLPEVALAVKKLEQGQEGDDGREF